jgi:AraC-like DNA-binding protein
MKSTVLQCFEREVQQRIRLRYHGFKNRHPNSPRVRWIQAAPHRTVFEGARYGALYKPARSGQSGSNRSGKLCAARAKPFLSRWKHFPPVMFPTRTSFLPMHATKKQLARFFSQLSSEHGLLLFNALPDTRFFIKNAAGVYMYASRGMCLAHGYNDDSSILGKCDHDFIPAYLADQYTRDDRDVLDGKEIWERVEMVMRHPGCTDWYVTSKIPLRSKHANIIGLAGVSRNLEAAAKFATPFTQLAPALDYIREHYAERLEVGKIAGLAGMAARSFQRHFKQAFHVSPTEHLRQFRLGKACQLLIETDLTIAAVAAETGFTDHSHLVRAFTKSLGETPGMYRKRYR